MKKILLHHDNSRAHSPAIVTAKVMELQYETLSHPLYFPDLALYFFKHEKKGLGDNYLKQIWMLSPILR